jgi:hypothetical protein
VTLPLRDSRRSGGAARDHLSTGAEAPSEGGAESELRPGERALEPIRFVDANGQLREISAERAEDLRLTFGEERFRSLLEGLKTRVPREPAGAAGDGTRTVTWEER